MFGFQIVRSFANKIRTGAVIAAGTCAVTLAFAQPAAAWRCYTDVDGANDYSGQKDVTAFCSGLGTGAPFELHTSVSLDQAGSTGGNSADTCLLFDSGKDGRIDIAVCTTLVGDPMAVTDVRLLTCNNSASSKCGGGVQINVCSGSGDTCMRDADCGSGTCAKQFVGGCFARQEATDPFANGQDSPWDTVVQCSLDLDEFGPAGTNARLINAGAYASSSLSSGLYDSVLPPLCESDADCPNGEVCHLASGECYDPDPEPCSDDSECSPGEVCDPETDLCVPGGCTSDQDCAAGKVCNPDTGMCETPGDGGCTDDDCAFGLVCDVETGQCKEPCASDGDCASLDSACGVGVCDLGNQLCFVEPVNEGLDCSGAEPDVCALSATCEAGACMVEPLCEAECATCDGGVCDPMCGNPFNPHTTGINITDGLFDLRAAVELESCALCVCDVNHSGTITAVDALIIARNVVGLPAVLDCPSGNE